MFNFTKKHSKTLVNTNEQATGVSEQFNAAIIKINRLEDELTQKTHELNQSYKAQQLMSEGVKNCLTSLDTVQTQLHALAVHLDRSNKRIFELTKKNRILKSSSDEWLKRAIKLEFDVLSVKDGLKKVENERDLAVQMCELLQVELLLTDKENSQSRNQD